MLLADVLGLPNHPSDYPHDSSTIRRPQILRLSRLRPDILKEFGEIAVTRQGRVEIQAVKGFDLVMSVEKQERLADEARVVACNDSYLNIIRVHLITEKTASEEKRLPTRHRLQSRQECRGPRPKRLPRRVCAKPIRDLLQRCVVASCWQQTTRIKVRERHWLDFDGAEVPSYSERSHLSKVTRLTTRPAVELA